MGQLGARTHAVSGRFISDEQTGRVHFGGQGLGCSLGDGPALCFGGFLELDCHASTRQRRTFSTRLHRLGRSCPTDLTKAAPMSRSNV